MISPPPRSVGRGRGWGGNFMRQPNRLKRIAPARRLRREMTEPEKRLWRNLRQLPLAASHFRRQAPIGPYFADFACHDVRLVLEVDGETHASTQAVEYDKARSAYLEANGYRVLRIYNHDVMTNIEGVMSVIHEAICRPTVQEPPPLTPPHASRGRGA